MSKQPSGSDLFAGIVTEPIDATQRQENGNNNELIKIQDNNFIRDVKAGGRDPGMPARIHHGNRDDQRKKPPQVPSLGNKIMQVQKARQMSNPSAGTGVSAISTVGGNTGKAEMVAGRSGDYIMPNG